MGADQGCLQPKCRYVDEDDAHELEVWLYEDMLCPRCNISDSRHGGGEGGEGE